MALELVGGAVLGVLFDQLRKEIWRVKDNVVMFKPKLEELEETLTVLYPVIDEIEEFNRRLNSHGRETIILRRLLEDGTKLVSKCSKVPRWDFLKQGRYRGKLVELDNKILRFHTLYLQAHMARDQKQNLLFVQEMRLMTAMSLMMITSLKQQGFSNLTMAITASSSTDSSDLTPASSTGSSNITVGITASSTGSSKKIVTKVRMRGPRGGLGKARGMSAFDDPRSAYTSDTSTACLSLEFCDLPMGKGSGVHHVVVEEDMEKLMVLGPVDPFKLRNSYWRKRGALPRFTCTVGGGLAQACFIYK